MPKKYSKEELTEFKKQQELIAPITRAEFLEHFDSLVDIVNEVKDNNLREFTSMVKTHKDFTGNATTTKDSTIAELRAELNRVIGELGKSHADINAKINARIMEVKDGLNGRDADETKIIEAVRSQIVIPEPEQMSNNIIRDKLEKLRGKERLEIDAINGLKKKLKELEDRPLGGGGGGFSYIHMDRHFVDDETPSGTVNGTNKIFTITKTPNPTGSLKVYVNGQRMKAGGEDYTLSARTITFVTAPPTTSILLCDYRF